MITDTGALVRIHLKGSDDPPGAVIPRERGEAWIKEYGEAGYRAGQFELLAVYTCWVCGKPAVHVDGDDRPPHNLLRCERHADRNPCCVEGCKRSIAAPIENGVPHLADDQAICGTHWRRYVPPGSRLRRAYHAHFRRAKRRGWTHRRIRQFERFWDALVRTIRRRSQVGHLDEAEINRLFGWGE